MKIRINDQLAVEPVVTLTATCPSGHASFNVSYLLDSICLHNTQVGPIFGIPNPIAILDLTTTPQKTIYFLDTTCPQHMPSLPARNPNLAYFQGSASGRPCWWTEKERTNRDAILDFYSQVLPN